MSGALVQLAAKGAQDVYIMSESGMSLFNMKYKRHTNFSQAPRFIKEITTTNNSIVIPTWGDLINSVWFEGVDLLTKFDGAVIDFYVGGVKIDSHPFDYISDIWQNYLAENFVKAQEILNKVSQSSSTFLPLHFFFCDNDMFLPLVALQFHEVEIRINFANQNVSGIKCYGNYIFLDTEERSKFINTPMDLVITQVQKTTDKIQTPKTTLDISTFNHPVKSLFFGYTAQGGVIEEDKLSFSSADIYLNGTALLENMTPLYFHTVQSYVNSKFGVINFVETQNCPLYTRYFAFHFCKNASEYKPTGTCNFSRLDNAKIVIRDIVKGTNRSGDTDLNVYAVNYNVFRIRNGLGGILFAN